MLCLLGTLALLVGSYLGAVLVFSILLIFGKARRFGAIRILAALGGGAPIVLSANAGLVPTDATYSLYQKNLYFNVAKPAKTVQDIQGTKPDFVTLQELSGRNRSVLT